MAEEGALKSRKSSQKTGIPKSDGVILKFEHFNDPLREWCQSYPGAKPGKAVEAAPKPPKKKAPILILPREIKDMIFEMLAKIASTCLGLASKDLYYVQWKLHGKVDPSWPLYSILRE